MAVSGGLLEVWLGSSCVFRVQPMGLSGSSWGIVGSWWGHPGVILGHPGGLAGVILWSSCVSLVYSWVVLGYLWVLLWSSCGHFVSLWCFYLATPASSLGLDLLQLFLSLCLLDIQLSSPHS